MGHTIDTPEAVATLGQLVRDSRMERFFWVFTADEIVFDTLVLSSRMPSSSHVFPGTETPETVAQMKRHVRMLQQAYPGKDIGVTFLHNHPSGDPTPSKADENLTRRLAQHFPVRQHVVIDSGGKFAVLEATTDFEPRLHHITDPPETDPLHEPSMPHALLGAKLRGTYDVVLLGKTLAVPGGAFPLFYRGSKGEVRGIEIVSVTDMSLLGTSPKGLDVLRKLLQARLRSFGARGAVAYIPGGVPIENALVDPLFRAGLLEDVVREEGSVTGHLWDVFGAERTPTRGRIVEEPGRKAS